MSNSSNEVSAPPAPASTGSEPGPDGGMEILLNGEPERVPVGCTIRALLDRLDLGGKRVAVAVDRDVIPRSHWAEAELAAGSRVEILEAVGGG